MCPFTDKSQDPTLFYVNYANKPLSALLLTCSTNLTLYEFDCGATRHSGESRHLQPPPIPFPRQHIRALPGVCQFAQSLLRMNKKHSSPHPLPRTAHTVISSRFYERNSSQEVNAALAQGIHTCILSSMGTLFSGCRPN